MIYFVERSDNGLIKIGTTTCLSQRLKSLFYEHRVEMKVLAVLEGGHAEERAMHGRWKHLRARQGEWFYPGDDLIAFINEECRPWDGTDERQTTLIRVSDEAADVMRDLAGIKHMSVADMLDHYCLELIRKDYRDKVCALARQFEGEG